MWNVIGRYYGFSKRSVAALLLVNTVLCATEGGRQALADHAHLQEIGRLLPENGRPLDDFGGAVAFSGDLALVGESGGLVENVACGAAHLFSRNRGGVNKWGRLTTLTATDRTVDDRFGCSVALSGNLVLVGAHEGADEKRLPGSAYLFARDHGGAGKWGQIAKLTATDGHGGDCFGWSVAISGDLAIVGALYARLDKTRCGVAYIFARNHGGPNRWGQVTKLVPRNPLPMGFFGCCVAISGDLVLIGENQYSEGLNSPQTYVRTGPGPVHEIVVRPAKRTTFGAAYLFARNQGGPNRWGQVAKLAPPKDSAQNGKFGDCVALSDDVAVVTAPLDHGKKPRRGATYVFERDHNRWGQAAKLVACDASERGIFGSSAAISGDTVLIGEVVQGGGAGAAYLFKRDHGGDAKWGQAARLTPSDGTPVTCFGQSVALSGRVGLVGSTLSYLGYHWLKPTSSVYLFDLEQKTSGP